MTRKQKILAKIRAWIDRQLPRDVLRVTVYRINPADPNDTIAILYSITHPEQILKCKMRGGPDAYTEGALLITFTTEHLSI